jgi:dTDP-4-amino-4,6-dideoxygalactose transaminase
MPSFKSIVAQSLTPKTIPVLRPRLPSADALLPYLHRIDATRIYSNNGPLASELERRLADHLRLPFRGLVSAASGTAALIGAILASAGRATPTRPLAILPAFTFVATAVAVELCGYQPYLADVDAENWMLNPLQLAHHPELDRIGLVVPVAPFGRPVPQHSWLDFAEQSKIPVVIDGAASFDPAADKPDEFFGAIPVVLSFHATKSYATGEGGAVATSDVELAARITQALNFGFYSARDSSSSSINGKMSEYHAAVGLAELDSWATKRAALRTVAEYYQRFSDEVRRADRLITAPTIASCYVLFRCAELKEQVRITESLKRNGVDFRLWYGEGVHRQTYFVGLARDSLEVTERLAPLLLGLPVAPDLNDAAIARVVSALSDGL